MTKLDISGHPQFGAIHEGLPQCIAPSDYIPLILVHNLENEFRSSANNFMSKAI